MGIPLVLLLLAEVFVDSVALTLVILVFGALAQVEMSKALNAAGLHPDIMDGAYILCSYISY